MDVDLRKPVHHEEPEKITLSNAHTDVSYVCIRKPSGKDRARLEDVSERAHCSLSKIYWLINQEKENPATITTDKIQEIIKQIKSDMLNVFISTLKCGHYESQLAVYPSIKPAVLWVTPSNPCSIKISIVSHADRPQASCCNLRTHWQWMDLSNYLRFEVPWLHRNTFSYRSNAMLVRNSPYRCLPRRNLLRQRQRRRQQHRRPVKRNPMWRIISIIFCLFPWRKRNQPHWFRSTINGSGRSIVRNSTERRKPAGWFCPFSSREIAFRGYPASNVSDHTQSSFPRPTTEI